MHEEIKTQIVVLGGGPGGYSAAFRAADLGKQVVLIEQYENLGGVCLNFGCIPSKAFLHAARVINEAKQFNENGISFGKPQIDTNKLRDWKNNIVKNLAIGLKGLAIKRKVMLLTGTGKFISSNQILVTTHEEHILISFENAIIAVGSSPDKLPFIPEDQRIMNSTDALNLYEIPKEMLIIGGGVIGLEMATIYNSLGTKVTIVESMKQLIPGVDADIVKPLEQYNAKKLEQIMLSTKVSKVDARPDGLFVTFDGKNTIAETKQFDRILVAIGRTPNGKLIDAEKAGVSVDKTGFITTNKQMRTNISHIFAIGDVVGNPMLAHKAVHEGRLAAGIIAGINSYQIEECIPSVAYTDPEIATVGLNENEAKTKGIAYTKAVFPWLANGRSLSLDRKEGLTKLLFDPISRKILGGSIVGPNAGELISEITLAIAMKSTANDIAHIIHPHPTLSETIMMAAEIFLGTITDLLPNHPETK